MPGKSIPAGLTSGEAVPWPLDAWNRVCNLYSVEGVLGEGGNGKVFSGTRRSDGLQVAIKIARGSQDCAPSREVCLLGKVQHLTGVAKLVGNVQVPGRQLIVFDLTDRAEGCIDLFELVSRRVCLGEPEASVIFRQVAKTAVQLQGAGVCHRDIKEENILVNTATLECWLLDFGCAAEAITGLYHDYSGTREYSPPEWIARRGYTGEGLSVWSLGILLYDMVVGNLPFETDAQIAAGHVSFPKDRMLSSEVRSLIMSCLRVSPEERPTLAGLLTHPWLSLDLSLEGRVSEPVVCAPPRPLANPLIGGERCEGEGRLLPASTGDSSSPGPLGSRLSAILRSNCAAALDFICGCCPPP
jgi:serine/threonine protein kinase